MATPELATDVSGNPYTEVFFDPDDFDPEVAYIQVVRFSESREWRVRGGVNIAPGVAALDFEAPFNVEASYRAQMFTAAGGSLGWTETASTTLEYDGTIIHQPLDPTLWARAAILLGTGESLSRPARGELVRTESGSAKWIGARRSDFTDVPMRLFTNTLAAADSVQAMAGSYTQSQVAVVCIRTSDTIRLPRTFFAAGTLEEVERNVRIRGSFIEHVGVLNEVEPPFPGLAVPLLTYDDLDAAYDTYDDRDAAYATYTDQDRDYSLAGLAG